MMIRLILERIDAETRSVDLDWDLELDDLQFVNRVLDMEEDSWAGSVVFDLAPQQFAAIASHYRLTDKIGESFGRIRARNRMDDLPYKAHTNRELKLMLSGGKPMAVFASRQPSPPEEPNLSEQPFAKWVDCGRLRKFEEIVFDDKEPTKGVAYTIYTLPDDSWRAKAYVLLKKAGMKSGWSAGMERMEGSLLGYTDHEIDTYLGMIFRKSPAHG